MEMNLAIDTTLLNQAVRLSGLKNQNDIVTLALKEFIQRREAEKLIDEFGTVDFDQSYDYKTERERNIPLIRPRKQLRASI